MNKKTYSSLAFMGLVIGSFATTTQAATTELYIYPAAGQTEEELATDRYECHLWASAETNFDPTQFTNSGIPTTVRVPVPENQAQGATEQGAVIGAVAGAVIGSQDSSAGQGAVIGAVLGSIAGSAVEQDGQRAAHAEAEQEAMQQAQENEGIRTELALKRANYQRAISACLEGRGYVVR